MHPDRSLEFTVYWCEAALPLLCCGVKCKRYIFYLISKFTEEYRPPYSHTFSHGNTHWTQGQNLAPLATPLAHFKEWCMTHMIYQGTKEEQVFTSPASSLWSFSSPYEPPGPPLWVYSWGRLLCLPTAAMEQTRRPVITQQDRQNSIRA